MSEADEFWARKFRERDQRAGVNATAQDRDPQAAARAQRAAKYLGIAPALAEAQPEVTERMVQTRRNQETIAQNPWMTGALQDPDMAALIPKGELGMLGRVVDGLLGKPLAPTPAPKSLIDSALAGVGVRSPAPLPEITPMQRGTRRYQASAPGELQAQIVVDTFTHLMSGGARAMAGLGRLRLQGEMGGGRGEGVFKGLEEGADFLDSYYRPQTDSKVGNYAIDAGHMLGDMALGFGLAPKAVAGFFGASTGLQSYSKFSARSDDKGEALGGAVVDATAEYAFEKTPMGLVAKAFGGKYAAGVVGEYLVREIGGEAATGGIQYVTDTTLADPTETFSVKGMGMAMLDSAVVAVLGGGMIAGLALPHQQQLKRAAREAQDMQGNADAMAAQSQIDGAMALAEKSEMAKIAPDEFAQIIQQGADTGAVRQVYVPVETIDALLANLELAEDERTTLTLYQQQIDDARPGNSDVVIPVGEFVARFKGSLYQSLRDDIRTTPGGPSAKEAREFEERKVAELEALDKAAAESETAEQSEDAQPSEGVVSASSKQQVFDLVKQQSLAAGRTEAEAQTTALLAASRAENLATERYGAYPDAMAAWKDIGFTIAPRGKGKKGAAKSVSTQDQSQRILYRGTNTSGERIAGGIGEGLLFATDREDIARLYGDSIEQIGVREDAKILQNGTAEFKKVTGRKGNVLFRSLRKRENLRDGANDAIEKARAAGYDAVDFGGEEGIAILNEAAFERQTEDVLASTVGDGTGQGTEGVTRTVEQGPRGKTDWFADGSTVVTLFAKADFSTMLHEMSHVFLEQEFKLAQGSNASERLKADVAIIEKWMAANGHPVVDGVIPTEAHELWARTGERYFREGKAPSAELRGAFTQFKTWLTGIYQSLKALTAYGPAPITQDIREVMDRIIATGDAIAENALVPMAQADMGMTDAEYAAYAQSVQGTQDAAEDVLLNKMMSAIRQRETQRIAEQRRNVQDELYKLFNEQPGVRALHLLRTGKWIGEPDREATPVKLNTGWLIDNYGEEILDRLPKGLPITRGDGVVGDIVAEMTGMPSGDALVQALVGFKAQADALRAAGGEKDLRTAYINRATDEMMAQRHGDIALDEAQIKEEAIAALNSERRGETLMVEFRAMNRREGKGGVVTPYQVLQEWARRKVSEGKVSDVASKSALNRYVRALNRARTAVEEAILKGDNAEAKRQKRAQLVNHVLLAEAKRTADELDPIVKRMKRYADKEAMASVDQDYMDRIHALLAGFSFRPMSQKAIDERNGFIKWAESQEPGFEPFVPERMGDLSVRNWSEASVAELLDLNEAMTSLIHLGRKKQELFDKQEAIQFAETVDQLETQIIDLPERKLGESSIGDSDRPFNQKVREAKGARETGQAILSSIFTSRGRAARARQWASDLLRFEVFADFIDGTKLGTGLANRMFISKATDAQNLFSKLTDEVIEPILNGLKGSDGKWRARLDDHITLPFTLNVSMSPNDPALGQPLSVSRRQYLGMLANTGNLSNLGKMAAGERWVSSPDSMTELTAFRDQLVSFASVDDLRLVNTIWAAVEKLWPHIVRVERAMTGVVPEKVVAMPYTAKGVEMTGGYWPVVWDSHRSLMGQKQAENMDSEKGKMFGIATPVGHTITRTDAVAPMEYSIDLVLGSHVNKVISRVAYAEFIRDAVRLWNAPRIAGAVRLRFGDEYHQQGLKWLKDQIPSGAVSAQGAKAMDVFLNGLRVNMSFAVLGASYSTMMAQTLGLSYSMAMVGDGKPGVGEYYVGKGMALMLKHMGTAQGGVADHAGAAQEFVFARSEEMSRRRHEVSQEAAEAYRKLKEQDTKYRRAQALAFVPIALMDLHAVSIPTWLGAYAKGIEHDGLTEDEAANYADKMVRLSQGSGRQKDLTQLQRGTAGQKFMSMFYTPGAVMFNQQWESLHEIQRGNKMKAGYPLFQMIIISSLAGALMQGDWPDEGDDKERSLAEWAIWALRNSLYEVAFGYPVVRDIANTLERKQRGEYSEYGSTPISFALQTLGAAGEAGFAIATREKGKTLVEGKDVKKLALALGVAFRFPGLQGGRTGQFWTDVANGEVEPQTAWDYVYGSAVGKLPEKEDAQ